MSKSAMKHISSKIAGMRVFISLKGISFYPVLDDSFKLVEALHKKLFVFTTFSLLSSLE